MKFTLRKKPSFEALKKELNEKFPAYELKMRGKQMLDVKKSATCAVIITSRGDKMLINGNFPSMGTQLVFTLSFILLGILIPLIIYFATFHKKFKAMEYEVGNFLENEYGTP